MKPKYPNFISDAIFIKPAKIITKFINGKPHTFFTIPDRFIIGKHLLSKPLTRTTNSRDHTKGLICQ